MTNGLTDEEIDALGAGFKIESFDQLWRAVGRLPFMSFDGPYAWRGVPDCSFGVKSSLHRHLEDKLGVTEVTEDGIRDVESQILNKARTWGLGREDKIQITDLQLLARLQHNGIPTRLLDVSASFLTALWFACTGDAHANKDGLLMAFNLTGYKPLFSEDVEPTWGAGADPTGFTLKNAVEQSELEKRPFVLRPSFLDSRMAAQEGFFLTSACPPVGWQREYREIPRPAVAGMYLGPSSYIPMGAAESMLFDIDPDFTRYHQALWAFQIPAELKSFIANALARNFNRTASMLFPDFDGLQKFGMTDVHLR